MELIIQKKGDGRKQIELIPSVKISIGRFSDPLNEDATQKYAELRLKVFQRDRFTCQGCGLHVKYDVKAGEMSLMASGYLEAHHKDNNHQHNSLSNLISLCPFCHQVFHIGFAGFQEKIRIIFLPSLPQADLNLLCTVIGIALYRGGKIGDEAAALYNFLEEQRWKAQQMYGEDFCDPKQLGAALSRLAKTKGKMYQQRKIVLQNIRILPVLNSFMTQIKYWSQTIFLPGTNNWEQNWDFLFQQWETKLYESK